MALRRRPRYADIVATLALVIAMGGTAYAADKLPPNSVDTAAIQDSAVTVAKLHNNSVNSNKVIDGSLKGTDLASETITSSQLATDSVQASEIADDSIDGGEIIDGSLTGTDISSNSIGLNDLVGTDVTGAISFGVAAGACITLNLGVSGAQVGQVATLTLVGSTALPATVLFGPLRVVSTNSISMNVCNLGSSSASVTGLGVRVVTFG